jgi:hypothetical protein
MRVIWEVGIGVVFLFVGTFVLFAVVIVARNKF